MNSKVAILIPSMNRVDFLIRTIQYYASIDSNHPIYIGDASDESSKQRLLNIANGKVELYYFHWKGLNDRKTMAKLSETAEKKYQYCAFQGDDDYFVPLSLSKCADFLGKNSEYATAQGMAALFALDRSGPYGKVEWLGPYGGRRELSGNTGSSRLKEITSNYWVPNFSVHRTNEFTKDMLNGVNTVIDRKFGEYINSFTMAIRGKSKYIDCLYLVRNVHDRIDHSSYYRWISSKRWHSSWDSLHKEISNTLMQKDLISKDTSLQYTKEYIESIMDFRDRVNKNCNYKTLLRNLVKRKELLIPYKKIRAIIYKMLIIFSSKNKLRFDNVSSKSSIYYSDFTPIFNSVKVYPALNDNNKNTI